MSTVVKVQQTVESVGKPKQCDVNIACSETLWNTVQVQHKEAIAVPLKLAIFLTSEQSSVPIPEHTHSTWEGLYVKGKLRGSLMPAIVPKAVPLPK